ncbi:MAG: hypothetical protein K5990_04160 [Oscillospiraceae bacterium]|nr:hypothetical protein [Oscillospiraceae bacterium]
MKDLLIPSSALILAILLIRLLFRRAISRRVQYALWLLVLLRLLVPVNLPAVAPSVLSAARPVQETVETVAELPLHLLPYAAYPVADYTASELPDRSPGAVLAEGEGSYGVVDADGDTVVFYRQRIQPAQVLNAVWCLGMAGMALWLLAANLRFARKLRRTRVPLDGAGSRLPVYLCDDIPSPCLFGLYRPAIYVTSAAAREPERLRYVLAHEETHARHLDPLWSLLRTVCLAVWWFDPLVWLAASCARQDCELACDEGTLARLGERERLAYGETLLALIPRHGGGALLAATTMTAGKRQMKDRIRRIAEHRRPIVLALVLALALTGAACAVTFTGAANGPDAGEPPASAPTEAASASDLREGERALSGAELEYFNERFFSQGTPGSGQFSIHNQFLLRTYASPEDIDLYELFYSGVGIRYAPLSDGELRLFDNSYTGTHKYPAAELDAVFYANTGLHIDETKQIGLDKFTYLPEYDAYYDTHGDTNVCGQIWITAGTREGDTVRLRYDLDGWRCATLRDMGDGVWHFVSNLPAEKPTIPTVLPEGEPWAVISLDAIEPSELPPVTLAAPEQFPERLGGWLANDAGVVVRLLVAQDGTTCAAVEEGYENGVTTARRFFTFPADAKNPCVRGFHDLFGYERGLIVLYDGEIARNTYGKRCAYYVFSEDGTPTQLAEIPCFGDLPAVIDLDGDGKNELVSAGWNEAWLYFQRGGTGYCAVPVCALLQAHLGDATVYWTGFDANSRCILVSGTRNGRHVALYLYFKGERLLVYEEPAPELRDHVLAGVEAPPEVLADAKAHVEARARDLTERKERGESPWAPDDWCVSGLERTTAAREDWTIELYRLEMMLHASDPDQVVWAGGTYVTEYGWVCGMYDPEPYLFYQIASDGTRRLLEGSVAVAYGPGNEFALDYIELRNGLRGPETVEGESLWMMFHLCDAAETLNAVGAAEAAVRADALERLVSGARQRDESKNLAELLRSIREEDRLTDAGRTALEELKALAGV